MLCFTHIEVLSVVAPRIHHTVAVAVVAHPMDALMMFGFMVGFFTLVTLLYRKELEVNVPALAGCLAAAAAYAFASDNAVLGVILAGVTLSEMGRWRSRRQGRLGRRGFLQKRRTTPLYQCESRIDRMFGPSEV